MSALVDQKESKLMPYMDMIANPCTATLMPGIFGDDEGLLARVKKTYVANTTDTCGYILWDATYNAVGSKQNFGNLFTWSSNDSTLQPPNTVSQPYGFGALAGQTPFNPLNVTALTLRDPANLFCSSDLVADARVVSACIQANYFGTMLDASGQIGFIQNMPVQTLIIGGAGAAPLSVDELFNNTSRTARLGLERNEVIARPMDGTDKFRNGVDGPMLIQNTTNGPSSMSDMYRANPSCVCGLVWRSTDSKSRLVFDVVKNISWRPNPISGLINPAPKTLGEPKVHEVHKILDSRSGDWATTYQQNSDSKLSQALVNPHHPRHKQAKNSFWQNLVGAGEAAYSAAKTPTGRRLINSAASYAARELEAEAAMAMSFLA